MNKLTRDFFNLIKAMLTGETYNNNKLDLAGLYQLSLENGLAGSIFPFLPQELANHESYQLFERIFFNYHLVDARHLAEIEKLKQIFNNEGLDHIFLKGSFLKKIYPESYMRSMGDIDILVKEHDLKRILSVLRKHNYKHFLSNESHDCYTSPSKILIEIHTRLNSEHTPRYTEFLNITWDNVHLVEKHNYELNYEYNLVYLLIHMVKHVNSSGIGVRSILDIGIFITQLSSKLDFNLINTFLKMCDLELFYKNILWLNKYYFEFELDSILDGFSQDEKFTIELTNYILTSGVHGKGSNFNRFSAPITAHARKGQKKRGRLRYVVSLIFPSFRTMRHRYKVLQWMPFLLPIMWIWRWIDYLIVQFKATCYKLKMIFRKDHKIDEMIRLYEKLGV